MMGYENLCMGCMRPLDDVGICPHCGFTKDTVQHYPYLPLRTLLNERYLIGQVITTASDSVLYMGFDTVQKAPVNIREFFPRNLATRIAGNNNVGVAPGKAREYQNCMLNYLDLWRNLAKMRELSAIVPVYDIFEELNTAYAVSESIEHITLRDYLLRAPEGYIPWERARNLFMPVLSTLQALHNNCIIHRAISPTSLIICNDGKMRLSNFSIWEANTQGSPLFFQDQPGYFAIEQYNNDYQQGPWTDIYGFTATLYRALVGNNPIDALTREINDKLMIPGKVAETIPAYVMNAMGNALQIYPNNRTRNVEQLRAQLSASPSETMANDPVYGENAPMPRRPRQENVQRQRVKTIVQDGNTIEDERIARRVRHEQAERERKARQKKTIIISIVALLAVIAIGVGVYFAVKNGEEEEPSVSQNVEMVDVQYFIGRSETDIKANSNFTQNFTFEFKYEYNEDVEAGIVTAQSVPAGSSIAKKSVIVLTVSKGVEMIELENYNGLMYEDAKKKLEEAGFKVSMVEKKNDGTHQQGEIYSQSHESGKTYEKGTEIIFQVWGEPETQTQSQSDTSSSSPETSANSFFRSVLGN